LNIQHSAQPAKVKRLLGHRCAVQPTGYSSRLTQQPAETDGLGLAQTKAQQPGKPDVQAIYKVNQP